MASASQTRTMGILWLAAAALAFGAAVVTYSRSGEIRIALLAAAIFLAAMGFGVLRRARRT
jgi:predicted membrane-bound mannosyltransferase